MNDEDMVITIAVLVGAHYFDDHLAKCIAAGEFDRETNDRTAEFMAFTCILEHLYNEFHLIQAQGGDAVWATPERMQNVGPRPEDDPVN